MIKTEKKTLKGTEYQVTQLTAKRGRQVLARLMKILGPGADGSLKDILAAITVEDVDYLCDVFAETSSIRVGEKWLRLTDQFDLHFAGNYSEMVDWLRYCLELNYADFLGDLLRSATPEAKAE